MFTKKEQKALNYFGGIKEFLSLCVSYREYYDNRPFSDPTEIDYDYTNINVLCVINKMCICEEKKCLDLIVDGNKYCVVLNDKSYEYLYRMQMTLAEIYEDLSEDYLENFSFLEAKPFCVSIIDGFVDSISLVDPKMFTENLSILDKVMED